MTNMENENLTWYEKYHTWIMVLLGLLFLIAFIFFVKVFFKTDPQNQAGQIFIDPAGNEVEAEKAEYVSASDDAPTIKLSTKSDGTVYGSYKDNTAGINGTFEGRYADNGELLYTTMQYEKNGKMVVEEMIFKVEGDQVAVAVGERFLGKNGIDIFTDVNAVDFTQIILQKK